MGTLTYAYKEYFVSTIWC